LDDIESYAESTRRTRKLTVSRDGCVLETDYRLRHDEHNQAGEW